MTRLAVGDGGPYYPHRQMCGAAQGFVWPPPHLAAKTVTMAASARGPTGCPPPLPTNRPTGMVQACVGHFVTPLKCTYDKYDWRVTSQKPHNKHKSPNKHDHHGGEAARPSSGVDLMNPCRLNGGRPCACFFQCRCRSDLIDSIK